MCVVTFDWEDNDAHEKVKTFIEKRRLAWAVVEVTNACNFNCKWCYANNGYKTKIKREHMPKSRLDRLLKILSKSGIRQITLSGGEPTVYPHLKHAVKKAKELGFVVHMNTNGFLLTRKLAKELAGLGLSQVQINIDSIKGENHDSVRGRKGSFRRAIQALKNAKAAGMTCVSQTVLTKDNENEIVEIFKFARSHGIQRCRVWDVMPSEGCGLENFDIRPTDYIKTLERLVSFAEDTEAKHIEIGEPHFPFKNTRIPTSYISCVATAGVLTNISCTGDVFFCVTQRNPMMNVFSLEEGFQEAYRKSLDEFMSSFSIPSECLGCPESERCRAGCYTRREHTKGMDYWCSSRAGCEGAAGQHEKLPSYLE
jgi:radical SAM protein with 4Fe4S-binding SPASM domain